jgi:hypothetical protein
MITLLEFCTSELILSYGPFFIHLIGQSKYIKGRWNRNWTMSFLCGIGVWIQGLILVRQVGILPLEPCASYFFNMVSCFLLVVWTVILFTSPHSWNDRCAITVSILLVEMRVSLMFCPDWPQTITILLISYSWVSGSRPAWTMS